MSEIEDLQEEIRLLKEREASLQRQLIIERQRRLHAEKIIENERNACLELKSLLDHQDKKFRSSLPNYYAKDSKCLNVCVLFNDLLPISYMCFVFALMITSLCGISSSELMCLSCSTNL